MCVVGVGLRDRTTACLGQFLEQCLPANGGSYARCVPIGLTYIYTGYERPAVIGWTVCRDFPKVSIELWCDRNVAKYR